ncbi:hypothetical protein OE699_05490 [Sedimentimonas flavescens]|uniref:DUF1127 domain-containing protein n=1 Tax=Sedimentimonas flavescens TaxID=2851012 RepID=A0ABT2ZXD0_9RHOB|nr:hypothetical protein [Sedimentimonas flavescens]MCT2538334.1 hypothetical protein [Sedimentimonas flavescens]MCV2878301.1 hypothetical protein [Sedimentimonas flavescens]
MTRLTHHAGPVPASSIEAAIAIHGARRVLIAALLATLRPRAARPLAANFVDLDDHMRRDIGLPPKSTSPPRPYWQHCGW